MFDKEILKKKIVLLDGAMGTCISKLNLTESQFKGNRFANINRSFNGLNDVLNITQPCIVASIHRSYLEAGSDIIETNTLNANNISLSDYGCEALCYEINLQGAKFAKTLAQEFSNKGQQRFVAGSIGTTSKSLTLATFDCSFDDLYMSYLPQINGLIDGGVDLFIIETIFDALNAKAALVAIEDVCQERKCNVPVILSCTINDLSGRILSGQTLDAFYRMFESFDLLAIGMNCGLGSEQMLPYIKQLDAISRFPVCVYPNAGLPDNEGHYHQTPMEFAESAEKMLKSGFVNIIGGCCGTTPEYIKLLSEKINLYSPHPINNLPHSSVLTGLESVTTDKEKVF